MEPLPGEHEEQVREIVRQELASAFALVLRRTQEDEAQLSRSPERNTTDEMIRNRLAQIFGELLQEYGTKGG
jgi:hypothetical protein